MLRSRLLGPAGALVATLALSGGVAAQPTATARSDPLEFAAALAGRLLLLSFDAGAAGQGHRI